MPNRFERSIEIAAPATELFDYIADLERHGEWATNPLTVTLDASPPQVGTTFRSEARLGGTRHDRGRITVLDRPARLEFVTEGSAGAVRNWFTISECEGGCVLTKGSHNVTLSVFSRLMIPVLAVIVPRMYDRNLRAIKEKVESARAG